MKISRLLAAISAVTLSAGAGQASAQEMQPGIFMVVKGKSQKIDRHGVCKTVSNSSANPIMVPVGTPQQWRTGNGAFLNNIGSMPGVSPVSTNGTDLSLLIKEDLGFVVVAKERR